MTFGTFFLSGRAFKNSCKMSLLSTPEALITFLSFISIATLATIFTMSIRTTSTSVDMWILWRTHALRLFFDSLKNSGYFLQLLKGERLSFLQEFTAQLIRTTLRNYLIPDLSLYLICIVTLLSFTSQSDCKLVNCFTFPLYRGVAKGGARRGGGRPPPQSQKKPFSEKG